ncbi:MAG: NADH dehydrogenase (quinone) subunit D [Chloroflexi bacterium]|nr:MAG: NADH dehydrogenase (quinone) subunit D [Chloroflexota bacterium]
MSTQRLADYIPTPLGVTLEEGPDQHLILNLGPHHPSTHGVLRLVLELDGEMVVNATPDIGYLHTGIEKTAESLQYQQALVVTDRMDYLAPLSNNLGYTLAVEKLLDVEVPPRAACIRVLLTELTRINSHLVWIGTQGMDLGAISTFLYALREREKLLDIFELCSGARMMASYFWIGGLLRDVPPTFEKAVQEVIDTFPARFDEYERLLTENPIFLERTEGLGVLTPEQAIALGTNGPIARGSGVDWDLRRDMPYGTYEQYQFEIPLGTKGDVYDRYMVRVREMRQSLNIVKQALNRMPEGPVKVNDRKIVPPPREELATSMEALIHHFKFYTEGIRPPPGEVYQAIESPKGEFGVYIVSDGSARPVRCHFRGPSFVNLQSLAQMVQGRLVADVIACIASIDIVLGEVDR